MEFVYEGLELKLNKREHTASITKTLKSNDTIFIPKLVEFEGNEYVIKSIEPFSIKDAKTLEFADDSEVETFETNRFYMSTLKKLQIPSSLKYLKDGWCQSLRELTDIEVSPKNQKFSYIDNTFLVEKSDENNSIYDILHYVRYDATEIVIPPQIKIIKPSSLHLHLNLRSIIFPSNSEVTKIEKFTFDLSKIEKLILSQKIEDIDSSNFLSLPNLIHFEVPKENNFFSYIDNQLLVRKSSENSQYYDVIKYANRNIEEVVIPSYIKKIDDYSFENCKQLKSITFEPESKVEYIGVGSFNNILGQNKLIIPKSVKTVQHDGFSNNKTIEYIEFLSEKICISMDCFNGCKNLTKISFPNATEIEFNFVFAELSKSIQIYLRKNVKFSNDEIFEYRDQIHYFDEKEEHQQNQEQQRDEEEDINEKIDQFIQDENYKGLIQFLKTKNDFDLTNNVFNIICKKNQLFYMKTIEEGVECEDPVSLYKYAIFLIFNPENESNRSKAIENFNRARDLLFKSIDLGFHLSHFLLARILHEFYNEDERAFNIAQNGSKLKEKYSQCLVGHFISRGIGTKKEFNRGVENMLNSGCQDYYERFANDIGIYYLNKKDDENAFKWIKKAFDNYISEATVNNAGLLYLNGIGVDKNVEKAEEIFNIGIKKGYSTSFYHLGFILIGKNQLDNGLKFLKTASDKGNKLAKASYEYFNGIKNEKKNEADDYEKKFEIPNLNEFIQDDN